MKRAFVHMTTFKGSSVDWYAEHFYGKLVYGSNNFNDPRENIQGVLTTAEAKRLNKAEPGAPYKYKAGDECGRFFSEDKLKATAIEMFKKDPRDFDILLYGECYACDPQEMLVGPKELMTKANKLFQEFEDLGGWDNEEIHGKRLREISDQWNEMTGGIQ